MEVLTDSTQRQSDSSEKLYLEFSFIKYICTHKYSIHIYQKKDPSRKDYAKELVKLMKWLLVPSSGTHSKY